MIQFCKTFEQVFGGHALSGAQKCSDLNVALWHVALIYVKVGFILRLRAAPSGTAYEQLLSRNVERFREGLVFKAHRFLCHSTPGSRVINDKEDSGFWQELAVLVFETAKEGGGDKELWAGWAEKVCLAP